MALTMAAIVREPSGRQHRRSHAELTMRRLANTLLSILILFVGLSACAALVSYILFGDASHGLPYMRVMASVVIGVGWPFQIVKPYRQ
jgi:hypothetical protein